MGGKDEDIPIGITLSGTNRHDMKKAADIVDAIVVERPDPEEQEQHLCIDKGYDYPGTGEEMAGRGYQAHIPQRGLDTPAPEPGIPIGIQLGVGWSSGRMVGSTASANY